MSRPNIRIFLKSGASLDLTVSEFSFQRVAGSVSWTNAGYPCLLSIDPGEIAAVVELRDPPPPLDDGARV